MELNEISNWFKANKLSVNASKTNYMTGYTSHITNKYIDVNEYCHDDDINSTINISFHNEEKVAKQKINVILDDLSLERVSLTKFVGVIDENLTWKNHIDAISKTISRNIGMLSKMKHYVPGYISLFSILYSSLVSRKLWYPNLGEHM